MFRPLLNTLRYILTHPLNRKQKIAAMQRFVAWQLASRMLPGAAVVPFANGTRLIVTSGMTGATGNIYCGLHEFEEMAFTLHALRAGDLFLDIGANIGAFSILAASRGASVLGFEPAPETFTRLLDNVHINRFESLIDCRNQALGSEEGKLRFTVQLDSINHVATPEDKGEVIEVPLVSLDSLALPLEGRHVLLKIDVEGFELPVLRGATKLLQHPGVLAVIMEVNGSGTRYGFSDEAVHEFMTALKFAPYRYTPFAREIRPASSDDEASGNVIYIRNREVVAQRIETAPNIAVQGAAF